MCTVEQWILKNCAGHIYSCVVKTNGLSYTMQKTYALQITMLWYEQALRASIHMGQTLIEVSLECFYGAFAFIYMEE